VPQIWAPPFILRRCAGRQLGWLSATSVVRCRRYVSGKARTPDSVRVAPPRAIAALRPFTRGSLKVLSPANVSHPSRAPTASLRQIARSLSISDIASPSRFNEQQTPDEFPNNLTLVRSIRHSTKGMSWAADLRARADQSRLLHLRGKMNSQWTRQGEHNGNRRNPDAVAEFSRSLRWTCYRNPSLDVFGQKVCSWRN
jgi:hypothetical protein